VNGNTWKVALRQQSVQLRCSLGALDEDDDLIELQLVEEVIQLPVLLFLVEFDIVLLETVQGELGLVIHIDLERRLHKLLANRSDLLRESSGKHHHLLLLRSGTENLLYITTHVCDRQR